MSSKAKGYGAANILVDRVEAVSVTTLKMFHKNPRVGNVDAIAESLKANGQFKPIVVNVGTLTKRKNEILAGNHTWMGTKRNGDEMILAAFVDVDENTATRINLADNKTADEGTYDDSILAELLATLPDAIGTGYKPEEFDDLIKSIEADAQATIDSVNDVNRQQEEFEGKLREKETFDGSDLGDEPSPAAEESGVTRPRVPEEEKDITKASDELKGGYALKEDMLLEGKDLLGEWGIPRLRSDMLATWDDLPEKLKAWAGSASKNEEDPDMWWLYNWGIDSTSGMKDVSKVIVSFFAYDDYFENWWWYPARYATKCLNSGIKILLTPDFSMADKTIESRVTSLWNVMRQRWVGRYCQESGLKVIPNITWAYQDLDLLWDHILPTLPDKVPLLAMQIQAVFDKKADPKDHVKAEREVAAVYQRIIDTVKPDALLLYYGAQGRDMWEKHVKFGGNVKWVESRMVALAEQASSRTKKKGI